MKTRSMYLSLLFSLFLSCILTVSCRNANKQNVKKTHSITYLRTGILYLCIFSYCNAYALTDLLKCLYVFIGRSSRVCYVKREKRLPKREIIVSPTTTAMTLWRILVSSIPLCLWLQQVLRSYTKTKLVQSAV